jgi:hypothetical protein
MPWSHFVSATGLPVFRVAGRRFSLISGIALIARTKRVRVNG